MKQLWRLGSMIKQLSHVTCKNGGFYLPSGKRVKNYLFSVHLDSKVLDIGANFKLKLGMIFSINPTF